ncbi:MAG: oxidase [candidate division WOR-3 bacterium]
MRKDLLLDENNDLKIENGDFVIGQSDQQHIELILRSAPGHWKQHPLIGADLTKMLNAPLSLYEKQQIKVALQADGYKVNNITFNDNGEVIVDVE